jgi:ATP-dependent helicase HrpA
MRHEAAGITTSAFPKMVRLGGVDCAASYLHEPGDPRDGMTVTMPAVRAQPGERRALRMAGARHAQGQDPGPAQEPAAAPAQPLCAAARVSATRLAELLGTPDRVWPHGSLTDALLKQVRDETSLDVKRADFKLDMLQPHLFMNFRVVDEHGRQLGMGRNLGALKAELGAKARGAFQALAGLKLAPGQPPGRRPEKTI